MTANPDLAVSEYIRAPTPYGARPIAQSTIFIETRWIPSKTSMMASRSRFTCARATPKKTAKTMRASISPWRASTAAASGLRGISERSVSVQGLAWLAFSMAFCDWEANVPSRLARTEGSIPTPGLKKLTRKMPTATEIPLAKSV